MRDLARACFAFACVWARVGGDIPGSFVGEIRNSAKLCPPQGLERGAEQGEQGGPTPHAPLLLHVTDVSAIEHRGRGAPVQN